MAPTYHACAVAGCPNRALGRYCSTHYRRLSQYGSLDAPRRTPVEDRFWAKVDRHAVGGCWLWTGIATRDGYGVIGVNGKQVRVHRYSYELHHGPIPDDMVVMHSCDTPRCVSPAHLRLGTTQENSADSARKARRPRGSANHASKLTEGQVLNLRDEYAAGGVTQAVLAARYGISPALVSFIVNRRAWAHI